MTLVQALTKSRTNLVLPSSLAYTSAKARSSELEPKIRSTGVAVHLSSPLAPSRISKTFAWSGEAFQTAPVDSRLTKKSFVRVPGRLVS